MFKLIHQKLIFITVIIVLLINPVLSKNDYYLWPLDENVAPALTSVFGEFRYKRLHAGIDFKTAGVINKPVFALDDGYVWRVKIHPYGYGKALYLKLNDGNIITYAHLDSFFDELDEYVYSKQIEKKSYAVDLFFKKDEFPLKKGDAAAYSGETGIGGPHLHLEVRNSANEPLNGTDYFDFHNKLNDYKPPIIQKIALFPFSDDSRIGIYNDIAVLQGDVLKENLPIYCRGRIAFGIKTYDYITKYLRTGVNKIRVTANDSLLYELHLKKVNYKDMREGQLVFNHILPKNERFHNLFALTDLNIMEKKKGEGVLDIEEGKVYSIKIESEDVLGNKSAVRFEIGDLKESRGIDSKYYYFKNSIEPKDFIITENRIISNDSLETDSLSYSGNTPLYSVSIGNFHRKNNISVIDKNSVSFWYDSLKLSIDKFPLYFEKSFIHFRKDYQPEQSEIKKVTDSLYVLMPFRLPLKHRVRVEIKIPEKYQDRKDVGIYIVNEKDKAYFVSHDRKEDVVYADIDEFSRYGLYLDDTPPEIDFYKPKNMRKLKNSGYRYRVKLADKGCGVDYRTIEIYLNGSLIIGQFEPEDDRLTFTHHCHIKDDFNTLLIKAEDFMGNYSERIYEWKY